MERLKLVLRAHYFLDAWEAFLGECGYKQSQYFLSREAADIARIIIEGYIALVLIHRDHIVGEAKPLLPWLHSSEPCELCYGDSRKIIKDFTMLDFVYMIPKLRIKMHRAVLRAKGSDPKALAAGYNHTWFDHAGINLNTLSTYPSNGDIQIAANQAAQEAESLIALLGVSPTQLHRAHAGILPSISSWYNPHENENIDPDYDDDMDSDSESLSEAQELQDLLDREEDRTLSRTAKQEKEIARLRSAAIAVIIDEAMKV